MAFHQRGVKNQFEVEKYMDKPLRYNGKGVLTARAWLELMNEYFDAIGVSSRYRAARTAFFLDGKALNHHYNYVRSLVPAPKLEVCAANGLKLKAMDWEAYMADMVLRFDPLDSQEAADKIFQLVQTHDVRRYVEQFEELRERLPDNLMSNHAVLVQQFTFGLNRETRDDVRAHTPTTLNEAKRLAILYADKHKDTFTRSTNYRDSGRSYRRRPKPMHLDAMSAENPDNESSADEFDESEEPDFEAKIMAVVAESRDRRLRRRNAPRISDDEYRRRKEYGLCFACGSDAHPASRCLKYPPPGKAKRRM